MAHSELVPVKILFFAQAREQTKLSEGQLKLPKQCSAINALKGVLEEFPSLKPLENCIILARNQNYLDIYSNEPIEFGANDELAVIPPISSGIVFWQSHIILFA